MNDLRLSLEHMTVLGLSPTQIVDTAEKLGVELISLILDTGSYRIAAPSFLERPGLTDKMVARLKSSRVRIHAAEGFLIDSNFDAERFQRLIEISARLGVDRGIVMISDPERERAIDQFGRLCEMAQPYDLQISLEFVAFAEVSTLSEACGIVEATAAANAAVSVDILHLMRTGGSPADLERDGLRFGAAQLCDGPRTLPRDQWEHEAVSGRLVPGTGEFPITAFLRALPANLVVGVEVPQGIPVTSPELLAEARRSIEAARAVSDRLR